MLHHHAQRKKGKGPDEEESEEEAKEEVSKGAERVVRPGDLPSDSSDDEDEEEEEEEEVSGIVCAYSQFCITPRAHEGECTTSAYACRNNENKLAAPAAN